MSVDENSPHLADFHFCHDCLEGDHAAITELQKRFGPSTEAYLVGAGAEAEEAIEVVASLWADLLAPSGDQPPRLARYSGLSSLRTWLNAVALNSMLARKRSEQRRLRHIAPQGHTAEGEEERSHASMADPDAAVPGDPPLIEIMRDSLERAFLECEPEDFVILQLKHCDGIRGTELAVMFGCDETVISRRLTKAQQHIGAVTLLQIRQTDPWLELKWEDFVELCRTATPACFGLD